MNLCFVSLVTVHHGMSGGMEIHGQLLTRGLADLGHEVTVLSSRHPAGRETERRDGVVFHYLPDTVFGSQRGRWSAQCTEQFAALHRRRPFDLVCCQAGIAPRALMAFCRRAGVPLVMIVEGHEGQMLMSEVRQTLSHRRGYARLPRRALAFLYHRLFWEGPLLAACDCVIAVSDQVAASLRRWYGVDPARIAIIPNGVDTELFSPDAARRASTRRALGIGEGEPVVLFLSHVTRQKGVHLLLQAMARLDVSPSPRLLVCGGGEYLQAARRTAAALALSPAVLFAGEVPHDRAPDFFAACDVFALPTLRDEGLPFALLEAMAAARPVVAAGIGGVASVVKPGDNGLLVAPGDADDLADALARILRDPALAGRLGAEARRTIVDGYSVRHMVTATQAVFERLTSPSHHVPATTEDEERRAPATAGAERRPMTLAVPPRLVAVAPTVSIVIPTHDDARDLAACLRALGALEYPRDRLELVVWDNASTDDTAKVVEAAFGALARQGWRDLRLLRSPQNLGSYIPYNAVQDRLAADSRYVLGLDADVELPPDTLRRLVDTAIGTGAAVVGARSVYFDRPERTAHGAGFVSPWTARYGERDARGSVVACDYVIGCCWLLDRAAFRAVAGFDPVFFLNHWEVDYCLRLKVNGHAVLYEPRAVARHKIVPGGTQGLRIYYVFRNKLVMIRRNPYFRAGAFTVCALLSAARILLTWARTRNAVEARLAWWGLLDGLRDRGGAVAAS